MTVIYHSTTATAVCFPSVNEVELPPGVSLVMPVQTHSCRVAVVTDPAACFPDTDALVTALPGVAVGVRTADCVPIVLHDPVKKIAGVAHAGWKGTVGRIAQATFETMCSLGSSPVNVKAVIGPSVCGLCYETSAEMAAGFRDAGLEGAIVRSPLPDPAGLQRFDSDSIRIDLQKSNTIVLEQAGLKAANIITSSICTRHHTGWPSWRRNPGTHERLATVVWMK